MFRPGCAAAACSTWFNSRPATGRGNSVVECSRLFQPREVPGSIPGPDIRCSRRREARNVLVHRLSTATRGNGLNECGGLISFAMQVQSLPAEIWFLQKVVDEGGAEL